MKALVRMIAIHLAGGNEERAEAYLAWAYFSDEEEDAVDTEEQTERRTRSFIRRYLTPTENYTTTMVSRALRAARTAQKMTNYMEVIRHIVKMPYEDFMKTLYWRAVADKVKELGGHKCSICGRLEAHHKTYCHHGDEINHLDDIVCLCHKCHKEVHNKHK